MDTLHSHFYGMLFDHFYQMKLFYSIIALTCFTITAKAQTLEVTVYNKTGRNLDSLIVGDTYVGYLAKNNSINVSCTELIMQDKLPLQPVHANALRINKEKGFYGICGVGIYTAKEGSYSFDIIIEKTRSKYVLLWKTHED